MGRIVELQNISYDPTMHQYRGELVPSFSPPVLKLVELGPDMFPGSQITLVDPTESILAALTSTPIKKEDLEDKIKIILLEHAEHIANTVRQSNDKNWIGFSLGKYWGAYPLQILANILQEKSISFDPSISQARGERGKRISNLGYHLKLIDL